MQDAKSSRATVFALLQWGEALVLGTPPPQNGGGGVVEKGGGGVICITPHYSAD